MNRAQKFETKWKKLEADLYAFADHSLETREEVKGLESLKHQGSLQEVAAVFTEEGLQIFAQLFANSVEQAIHRNLGQAVEQAVEKKMTEVFEIATNKIRQVTGSYLQTAREWKSEITLPDTGRIQPLKVIKEESQLMEDTKSDAVVPQNPVMKKKRADSIREQADIVANYLRQNGRTKVVELVRNIDSVYWSTNPWIKISQFCKVNPSIRKIKNGTFEYAPLEM